MSTNYQRGRAFEYRVRSLLHKYGISCVVRSSGSRGAFDLVAIGPNRGVLLIQCKLYQSTLPKADRDKVRAAMISLWEARANRSAEGLVVAVVAYMDKARGPVMIRELLPSAAGDVGYGKPITLEGALSGSEIVANKGLSYGKIIF